MDPLTVRISAFWKQNKIYNKLNRRALEPIFMRNAIKK